MVLWVIHWPFTQEIPVRISVNPKFYSNFFFSFFMFFGYFWSPKWNYRGQNALFIIKIDVLLYISQKMACYSSEPLFHTVLIWLTVRISINQNKLYLLANARLLRASAIYEKLVFERWLAIEQRERGSGTYWTKGCAYVSL